MIEYRRNKYYDPILSRRDNDLHCLVYDALEVALSVYKGKVYLITVPTVFVADYDDRAFDRLANQKKVNSVMSKVYNGQYNDKLKIWNRLLTKDRLFSFSNGSFTLSFNMVSLSSGGVNRKQEWPTKVSYRFPEPEMLFSLIDQCKKSVNQLKGISRYAPIDCSYYTERTQRPSVRLAIISPQEAISKLLGHLAKLKRRTLPNRQNDGFLTEYSGFDTVFKRGLVIPDANDKSTVLLYSQSQTANMNEMEYLAFLKRYIDRLSGQNDFDIAIIYVPNNLSHFRENQATDFDLHDAVKLYATDKSVKVQFIEERSIDFYDQCKVMWGLSTGLYAKAAGVLWQPVTMDDSTAFVGVSYAISKNKRICVGCSQLFDSTGTGVRLLLRQIKNPGYWGKNPYMKVSDKAESH